jgi:hypothetical protein
LFTGNLCVFFFPSDFSLDCIFLASIDVGLLISFEFHHREYKLSYAL